MDTGECRRSVGPWTPVLRTNESAQACINLMHGRSFDGRTVQASLATGKEKYRRSKDKDDGGDEDEA